MCSGNAKEEYGELAEDMRHYGNMRFAQLTLYFALMAGLVTAVFATQPPLHAGVRVVLKIAGVVSTLAFCVMEERAADYWHHFRKRASHLEDQLGYQRYSTKAMGRWLTATNAVRLLFLASALGWLAALKWQC